MVAMRDNLTLIVHFQSSPRNRLQDGRARKYLGFLGGKTLFPSTSARILELYLFGNVTFIPRLTVEDRNIKEWRSSLGNLVGSGSMIASTNIGYLATQDTWLDVNLANPRARNRRLGAIIELVRKTGLPWFEFFSRPQEVVDVLTERQIPGMLDSVQVEYAMCYGGEAAARTVLHPCTRQWPGCDDDYRSALKEYRQNGIPSAWDAKAGPVLAMTALKLGIET
jgi:hypothetical protein